MEITITFFLLALMAVIGGASYFLYCQLSDVCERLNAWLAQRDLEKRMQAMTKQAYSRRYK